MESIKSPGIILYLSYFYSYYLPIILYIIWTPLSLFDLGKKNDLSSSSSIIWTVLIIGFPWVGTLAYLFLGKPNISLQFRLLLVVPGLFLILIFGVLSTLTST